MEKLNVGLVGAGRIGRVHAENLAYRVPEARLVAVSDIVVEAAQELAAELGVPAAHQNHRRIMEDESVEAVVVCSSGASQKFLGYN